MHAGRINEVRIGGTIYTMQELEPDVYRIGFPDGTEIGRIALLRGSGTRGRDWWKTPDGERFVSHTQAIPALAAAYWRDRPGVVFTPSPAPVTVPPASDEAIPLVEVPPTGWLSCSAAAPAYGMKRGKLDYHIRTGKVRAVRVLASNSQYGFMYYVPSPAPVAPAPAVAAPVSPPAIPVVPIPAGYLPVSAATAAYHLSNNALLGQIRAGLIPAIKVAKPQYPGYYYMVAPPSEPPAPVDVPAVPAMDPALLADLATRLRALESLVRPNGPLDLPLRTNAERLARLEALIAPPAPEAPPPVPTPRKPWYGPRWFQLLLWGIVRSEGQT